VCVGLTVALVLKTTPIQNFVKRNTGQNKNFCYRFFLGFCVGVFPSTVSRLCLKGRPLLLSINAINTATGKLARYKHHTMGRVNKRIILLLMVKIGFTDAFVRQTSSYSRGQRNSSGLFSRHSLSL
jgi:hypothetical protein